MQIKRAGFTMIELVFVIVILGVLASVAIPKLAATRDDAEVAAGVQRANNIINDIGAYYTAHGKFDIVSKMTNEELIDNTNAKYDGNLTTEVFFANIPRTKKCLGYRVDDSNGTLIVRDLGNSNSFCTSLVNVMDSSIREHYFGGSRIYEK